MPLQNENEQATGNGHQVSIKPSSTLTVEPVGDPSDLEDYNENPPEKDEIEESDLEDEDEGDDEEVEEQDEVRATYLSKAEKERLMKDNEKDEDYDEASDEESEDEDELEDIGHDEVVARQGMRSGLRSADRK